jgi:hypothetical protein
MKFEIGETVYALHFDQKQYIYLKECIVIGIKKTPLFDAYTDDLRRLLTNPEIELMPVCFDDEKNKYYFDGDIDSEGAFFHPESLVFKTKMEASLYLHGIVSDIAK